MTKKKTLRDQIANMSIDVDVICMKQAVGGRSPRYVPPRPATEARSGNLEPGRPSRARSANSQSTASPGWPTSARLPDVGLHDRRQTASSLSAPLAGHNNHYNGVVIGFQKILKIDEVVNDGNFATKNHWKFFFSTKIRALITAAAVVVFLSLHVLFSLT